LAERTGACVLIKGSRSVIASPDGDVYVNSTGNPECPRREWVTRFPESSARCSDSTWRPLDALALGVFLHATRPIASPRGWARVGYIAGDLIDELPHGPGSTN